MLATVLALTLSLAQLDGSADAASQNPRWDGFTRYTIQNARDAITPAVCILNYSSEVTNASSGETSKRAGHALGLIVSPDGLIIAHGHMLLENRKPLNIKVKVGEGDEQAEYEGTVLNKPDDINILFIRIKTDEEIEFPYIEFNDLATLEFGEEVLTFGLLGETLEYAKGFQTRRIGAILTEPRVTYALDRPISFGYIGGPVINEDGEAVGVVGFDLSSSEGGELYTRSGHPLVYQSTLFREYLENPPSEERHEDEREDAWLGIFTQPLTDDLAEYWGLPREGGIVVSTVLPGSPAAVAGILSGDVITKFADTDITAKQDKDVVPFTKIVRESEVGQTVPLRFYRNGEARTMDLLLRSRPKSAQDAREFVDEIFGLTVKEITTDVRIVLNITEEVPGVIIRRVKSGSSASIAGIRAGYIIQKFGEHDITDIDSFEAAIKAEAEAKPDEITVFCRIVANTAFFRIQPRWDDD